MQQHTNVDVDDGGPNDDDDDGDRATPVEICCFFFCFFSFHSSVDSLFSRLVFFIFISFHFFLCVPCFLSLYKIRTVAETESDADDDDDDDDDNNIVFCAHTNNTLRWLWLLLWLLHLSLLARK